MLFIICLFLVIGIYYICNPDEEWLYLGLDGSIVKPITCTMETIVVYYMKEDDNRFDYASNPINLSRSYFKTHYVRWRRS